MLLMLMLIGTSSATILNPLFEDAQKPALCSFYECLQPTHVTDFYSICMIYTNDTSTYSSLSCQNYYLPNNFCNLSSLNLSEPNTYQIRCSEPTLEYFSLYPGEYPCTSDGDCVSGICENLYCEGVELDMPCNYTHQCQQGLICEGANLTDNETGECVSAIRPFKGICYSDFDCVNSAGCDYSLESDFGLCKPYFSIPIGGFILNCTNFMSMLCESGSCNISANGTFVCVKAYTSLNPYPIPCYDGTECFDSTKKIYSQCSCGMNDQATAYCQLFPGDKIAQEFIKILKQWTSSYAILACSTERRWSTECLKNWDPLLFDHLTYYMLKYSNFTNLIHNEDCTKDIFTYQYWEAARYIKENSKNEAIIIGLSLGAFLLI